MNKSLNDSLVKVLMYKLTLRVPCIVVKLNNRLLFTGTQSPFVLKKKSQTLVRVTSHFAIFPNGMENPKASNIYPQYLFHRKDLML